MNLKDRITMAAILIIIIPTLGWLCAEWKEASTGLPIRIYSWSQYKNAWKRVVV